MIDESQQPVPQSEISSIAMESYKSRIVPRFVAQWLIACAIGYALGTSTSIVAAENIGYSFWDTTVRTLGLTQELGKYNYIFASALMGGVLGLTTSFCQWIVLRRYLRNSLWWVVIGTICYSGGIKLNSIALTVISYQVANLSTYDWRLQLGMFILTVFTGLVTGLFEWLILRRKLLNSTRWIGIRIIANTTVFLLSYPALSIQISLGVNGFSRFISNVLFGLVCGVLIGIFSGFTLSSLSNKKSSTEIWS